MAEVSWTAKYDINIEGLDGEDVFHLREALRERAKEFSDEKHPTGVFKQVIEICDFIIEIDDRD